MMIDCAKDVRAYHKQDVTLPESEQKKMRDRRNFNRDAAAQWSGQGGQARAHRVRQAGQLRHEDDDSGPGQ